MDANHKMLHYTLIAHLARYGLVKMYKVPLAYGTVLGLGVIISFGPYDTLIEQILWLLAIQLVGILGFGCCSHWPLMGLAKLEQIQRIYGPKTRAALSCLVAKNFATEIDIYAMAKLAGEFVPVRATKEQLRGYGIDLGPAIPSPFDTVDDAIAALTLAQNERQRDGVEVRFEMQRYLGQLNPTAEEVTAFRAKKASL